MADQKRLFLLDAFALIFRGYYALIKNPRITSTGMDVSAIMGFTNSLFDVIKRERPDHLAVAFDKGGSSARLEVFPEYKANRDETPEAIKIAVPYIKQILEAMHIPIIERVGVEADDLIGTLSKQAEKEGFKTYMVTPDKDYAQLVSENIFMYRPARMGNGIEIWGIPEVQKRFEIERPEQVIDYLGMMGDSVDNIPGLPGVGDKTAKKFLAQYGSIEGLLANTHELKGKMKEKVEANAELGLLSKRLATIMLDCDVQFNAVDYELSKPDAEAVGKIFDELEFRRMKEQFVKIFSGDPAQTTTSATETPAAQQKQSKPAAGAGQFSLFGGDSEVTAEMQAGSTRKSIKDTAHFYQYIDSPLSRKLFLKQLLEQTTVCFDTETTGLDPITAELVGIAFSWEVGKGFYIPFPEDREESNEILDGLRPFFEATHIEKIGQNLKYDIKTYLNYTPISITELIGKKGKNQLSMRQVALEQQTEYAVEDTDVTLQLKEYFEKELEEAGTRKLFDEIEVPLLRVLGAMELEGINLDVPFLNNLSTALDEDIQRLTSEIYAAAETEFNIGSPKQLGEILFDKMKLVDKPKKTKTGQYSTAEDVLSYLAKDHQIIQNVLDYRGLTKLKSTYVDALPTQVNTDHRVHTDYMQTVAATGRLSSNNPNLQNIPIRTERGREVRKAFIPRDRDHILLAADYSQIELRIIAALSEEETMIKAFQEGQDIHASTAAKVFNVPIDEVTREQRSNAKTVNFGIIYGVSAFGLSNQTDLSRSEAKELIDTYYKTYPRLRNYMSEQVDFARDNGYVQTVLGRRRYLKDINSRNAVVRGAAERNAVNAPIQGSAADIIKIAMINIYEKLEAGNYKTKMLLQVHDELVFDVFKPELEAIKTLVKTEMENAYQLTVPLDVDLGLGENWLEAH